MKKLFLTGLLLCISMIGICQVQSMTNGEYYLDTDPGAGNGVVLTVANTDSVNQTVTVNTSSLATGFHRVYLRYKDSVGHWGNTMSYLFTVLSTSSSGGALVIPLVKGEYFLDTDPGIGNGTAIGSFSNADSVNQTISVSTTGLSAGFHRVYLRYKDSVGFWGNTQSYLFSTLTTSSSGGALVIPLVKGEYFLDTDPGAGNGTAISSFSNADSVSQTISVSTTGLSVGFHRVYLRYKDSVGFWGNTQSYLFSVLSTSLSGGNVTVPVSNGEYFVDTDPGPGNGTPLSSFYNADSVSQNVSVNTSGLTTGFHRVYVRYRDSVGHWGNPSNYLFTVTAPTGASPYPPIVAGEYFMDMADPGPGNGTPFGSFASADSLTQNLSINTSSMTNGSHSLFVRFVDSTGHWGEVSPVVFSICANSPGIINGTTTLCIGSFTTLTDTSAGGTWSSSNTSVATIGTNGELTGISTGNAQITYAVTTSCGNVFQVADVTIEALAGLAPISGVGSVCVGATTTLTDTGGVWSSANSYYATVGTNGVVTGQNAGTVLISYTSTNVCGTAVKTETVTVNPLPATPPAIAGITSVCTGNTTSLSDATGGGTWSSSNTSVATVGSSGLVSGWVAGTTTITYKVTNGCGSSFITAALNVLVIPTVNAISGTNTLCAGSSTTLNDITGSGNWSSSNTAIATVNSSGQVSGMAAGSITVSYTVANICGSTSATLLMSINPLPVSPAAITGASIVCTGANITLSDISGGGIWSCSNTSIASVASTGIVTGIASGVITISYIETNSCGNASATTIVTVDQLPNAGSISGTTPICIGSTTNLTDPVSGTTAWSSGNTSIAIVGSTGIVTGIGGGSVNISYAVTNNCGTSYTSYVVTVDTVLTTAGTITGPGAVCPGGNINLTDALSGGVWTASNTNVVVTDLGLVHGVAAGTATISYSVSNVCGAIGATALIFINPLPVAGIINGVGTVCLASPVTFSDTSAGGVWSSSNSTVASVGSNTGIVTGVFPGTATIIYSVTNSCGTSTDIHSIVVNPYAGIISGPNSVTAGASVTLMETVSGGVWSSSNTEIATINGSSGVVTGVVLGYTTISYTVVTSCGTAVDTMAFAVGYCIPDHDSAVASLREGLIIGKFVFAGLVDSLIDFSRPNGTTNYEDLTATFTAYASVNSSVICGIRDSLGLGSAQVYIDFNNDEIFEPSESVGGMSSVNNVITAFNVTIPTHADTGMHRMRVIFSYGGGIYGGGTYPNLNPCAVSLYGDVRDYSVYIQNYPIFSGGSAPTVRACMNTPTPIDTVLSVFNEAAGDAEQWTILSYPYHGTLNGFPETRTTTGGIVTPTGLSYTGAYGYNGDDEFTIRVYDGARYTDAAVHVVDGISSIVGAIVIDTASSLALTDSTAGGTWSSNNTTIATINPTTGVATAGLINGVAIITYSLTDTVCGSIYTTTELPVVAEACYPSFINSPASKADDVSLQGFAISGELGTYINDFVPCNGTDNYENLDSTFTVTLSKNTTYTVNFPGNQSESIQVWIDFNNNGVFEASEIVGGGTWPYYGENHITIGRHVATGIFRMRVVANAPQYPIHDTTGQYYPNINPCDFYAQYGDGRDYNVVIDSLNHPPHYAKTFRVPDLNNICMNSGAINIDSMLAITDIDSGQTETWTVINAGHGTFGGFNNTQISNGGLVIDSGLTYTPDTGFSGYDEFIVQVSDGSATDVITIGVHVGLPDPGVIYADGTCNGDPHEVYTGYSCLGLFDYIGYHLRGFDQSYSFPPGVWTSSDTAVATINSVTGTVTGVSPGTTTITYRVTGGCGTSYTTYEVIDIPPPVVIPCDCPPPPPPPPPPPACISAYFFNGFYQNLTVCAGTINNNIDSLLTVNDANSNLALTETWYVGAAPLHGTLGGFNYAVGTMGGIAAPAGLSYTPDSGFTGHDAFAVYISNGICTPYWTYISVLVGPYAGIITGDSIFAMGSPDTLLYDAEPDGIWTSSNADVADVSIFSIGRYGILSFISPGNSVITYTVDNFCGEASTTHPIRVDNDNLYLKGKYVQLGIAPNGSFGSTLDAPYYFNANAPDIAYWDPEACYSDTSFRKLGMVYDFGHNGFSTGSPAYFGDYVVHGVPQEGWSVSLDGVTSSAFNYNYQYLCSGYTGWFNTSASHNTGAAVIGNTAVATWQGKIDSANRHFAITQTTQLDTNASWVLMTTKIVNNGVTVNNVFFNRTISPKNDLGEAGSLITTNKISSSLPPGEDMVYANGTVYNNAFIGLATRDSRAKAYIIDSGILTMDSLAKIWLGTSPYLLSGKDTAAAAVGLVYNLGTINAGDSVSFTYAYIFDDTTGIDSVFGNPELVVEGSLYPAADTITNCNIHSYSSYDTAVYLNAGVVNGGDYSWHWAPSTGLLADTGVNNLIHLNEVSGKLVFTITGTSNSIGDTVKRIFNIVVNTSPPANSITGTFLTCVGSPDTLADTVTGGIWLSTSTAIASIGSNTGILNSETAGIDTIGYIVSNTCGSTVAAAILTVNALLAPGIISGPNSVCVGSTISLSDTGTGVWSSGSPGIAAVGSTGIVTGAAGGTATISFTTTSLCGNATAAYVVTVTAIPSAGYISGNTSVCAGTTTQLNDIAGGGGGIWSSGNTSVAATGSTGLVTAVTGGTATISYTVNNSCGIASANTIVTVVSTVPSAGTISGTTIICQGASAQMSDSAPYGQWSSSNSAIVLITNGGEITGLSGGTVTISYTVYNSCGSASATLVETVNPLPNPPGVITGVTGIYLDSITALSDTTSGGVWSSGNTSVAIVGSTGIVTGVGIGTAKISYTLTNDCGSVRSVRIVTVDPISGTDVITGTLTVCVGAITSLTDTTAGGTWSSSANATVDGSGNVTGVAAGTAAISYIISGIATTAVVTINPLANAGSISGSAGVCVGSNATLSDIVASGIWSSGNTSVATVSGTGIVTGVAAGSTTISYTVTNGCGNVSATVLIMVNTTADAGVITGTTSICQGATSQMSDAAPGGLWSSGNTAVAVITNGGLVTGQYGGTATISYTVNNGCGSAYATTVITINPLPLAPGPITGTLSIYLDSATTLADTTNGGVWSSGNTSIATVGSTGIVTGVGIGTARISYTVTNDCGSMRSMRIVTVNPDPGTDTITGTLLVCGNSTTALTDGVVGGTWTTSNPIVATIGSSTGIVTGVVAGTATISYTIAADITTAVVTVYAVPDISVEQQLNPSICGGINGQMTIQGLSTGITYTLYYTENGTTLSETATVGSDFTMTIGSLSASDTIRNIYIQIPSGCYTNTLIGPYYFISPTPPYINVNGETNPTICNGNNGYLTIGGGLAYDTTYTLYYTENSVAHSLTTTTSSFGDITIGSLSAFDTIRNIFLQTPGGCYTDTIAGPYVLSNPAAPYISGVYETNPSVCDGNNGSLMVEGGLTADTLYTLFYTENGIVHFGTVTAGEYGDVTVGSLSAADTIRYIYLQTSGGCYTDSLNGPYYFTNPLPPNINMEFETNPSVCNGNNGYLTIGGGLAYDTSYTLFYTENGVSHSDVVTASDFGTITIGSLSSFDTVRNIYLQTPGGCYTDTIAGPYALSNPSAPYIGGTNETNPSVCNGSNGYLVVEGGLIQDTTYTLFYTENGVAHSESIVAGAFGNVTIGSLSAADTIHHIYLQTTGGCYTDSLAGPYYFTNPTPPYINVSNETNPTICNGSNGYLTVGGGLAYDTTYSLYYTKNGTVHSEVVTAGIFGSVTIGSLSAFDTVRNIYVQTSGGCNTDTIAGPYFLYNPEAPYIMGENLTNPSICDGNNGFLLIEGDFVADTTYTLYYTENGVAHSGSVIASGYGITIGSLSASDTVRYIYVQTTGGCYSDSAVGPYKVTNPSPPYISMAYETYPTICNGNNGSITFGGGLTPDTAYTLYYSDNGVMHSEVIIANGFGAIVLGSLSAFDTIRNIYLQIPGGCYTDTIAGPYALNNPLPPNISVVNQTNPGACGGHDGIIGIGGGLYQDTSYNVYYKENGVTYSTLAIAGIGNEILFDSLSALDTISEIYIETSSGCLSNTITSAYYLSNPSVPTISGPNSVCLGSSVTLSDYVAGGAWSSTANVTIDGSGDATGASAGTATITYYLGVGCSTMTTMTVNTSPNAGSISGASIVNVGSSITLTDAAIGGAWSASNGNATVTGGVVHGAAAGSVTISYTATNSCGSAIATWLVTVNGGSLLPITGPKVVCVGSSITLDDATTGGVWTSSATSLATVGSGSGVVNGTSAGVVTITYTKETGFVTAVVTINPLPSVIGGVKIVCAGSVTNLSDATTGGTWASSNANATVDGSGDVAGLTTGTVNITYALASGCSTHVTVTVNPLPAVITGSNNVCVGSTITVSDVTTGGVWTSTNTSIATIGSSTHIITGVTAGSDNVIYTLTTGCARAFAVTVNPISSILGGSSTVCVGSTILLSDAAGAGIWSSSSTAKATVGSTNGIVTGIASGTSKITYTSSAGCSATRIVTVNPITSILGNAVVCQGATTSLSDATGGGMWTSNNTAIATFAGTSGVVSAIAPGSATVTYTIASTGCTSSTTVVVNPTTVIIGAPTSVCVGSTATLSDATPGGVWSSSAATKASIGSLTGIVTGLASGTSTITYLVSATGCKSTATVSVAPISAILGTTVMCSASTITLSEATAGGTWTSSNTAAATIGSSGSSVAISGVSPGGITTITYATVGCSASVVLTVNQSPAIGGTNTVCTGLITTLTDNLGGGTWTSSNTAKATVDASGDVTGLAAGTSIVSYMATTGCGTSMTVSVNANPTAILGGGLVCAGNVLSLSDATAGGSWTTSAGVSLTGSGGSVTGVATGTAAVTYTVAGGCMVTKTVTVTATPTAISGGNNICAGNTLSLTDGVSGGIWTSSSTSIATIGAASGILTGVATGTTNITYMMTAGCYVTAVATVNAIQAITGGANVCTGSTLSLSDMSSGGTWSTSSSNIIIGSTGLVTGISAGTATVVYTLASGCSRSVTITVNSSPTPIAGVLSMCSGTSTSLSDDGSGSWSMASIVATVVGSTGVVTASTSYVGTATVTYAAGAGCTAIAVVTVSANPGTIQGVFTECAGATIFLSDATAGGSWTGSGDATVSGAGTTGTLVAGAAGGTASVTYTFPTGCYITAANTVKPNPVAISGTTTICVGSITILSDATTGSASWLSSNTAIASAAGGDITGMSAGMSTITYLLNTGCFTTTTVSVINASAITGNTGAICPNATLSLTDAATPGVWSSSNSSVATAGTSGTVTTYASGMATITFMTTGVSGCVSTTVVTVSATPAITGVTNLCANTSITLYDPSSGGTWTSGNTSIATVGTGGVVSGVGPGTVVVSYTTLSGCTVITTLTVNAAPGVINGNAGTCLGSSLTLTDNVSGGVWSSSVTGHATVGSSSGIVTGVTAGTTSTITYSATSGCYVTTIVSINAQPGAILGANSVCVGSNIQLSNTTTGGNWSSSGAGSVGSAGLFSGGSLAGTTTVSYTMASGCGVGEVVTTNAQPAVLTGPMAVCSGASITLNDAVSGGAWTASSGLVTVDGSGDVTAAFATGGTATVTYTLPGGCFTTAVITVTNLPSAILGANSVCSGLTISLSNSSTGGVWSSSNTAIATVGSSGVLAGVGAGVVTISYTVGSGCTTSEIVTVSALPEAITGSTTICEGTTSALADTGSGTWSITPSLFATISSVGVVTASATYTGTTTVTYTAANTGCKATTVITVVSRPTAIQGIGAECAGITITLSDATAGGTWSGTGDATVSGTGTAGTLLAGAVAGSATVTYTMAAGCYITFTNTIYTHPQPILGNFNMCVGLVTYLSDASPVSSWSSSNTAIAVASGPDISGESVGTATITFKSSATGNCIATQVVTVSAMPVVTAVNGPATISHAGGAVTISDATAGGVWTSSNSSVIALGGSTGSPVSATALTTTGSSVIAYAVTNNGCTTKVTKTIGAATASHPQGETATIYAGSAVSLADDVAGGAWSSSDHAIATVDGSGLVTGVAPGSVIITHEFAGVDGIVDRSATNVVVTAMPVNINILPNPNKGTFTVKGTVGSVADEAVTLEVTDLLGEVIYHSKVVAEDGKINEKIMLGDVANGMYILNVQSGTAHNTFHFVIEQ